MPKEIIENFRTKTAPRTLRKFLSWGFAAYLMRTVYAGSIGDFLTAVAALPGALGAAILLIQQYIYRAPQVANIPVRVQPMPVEGDGVTYMSVVITCGSLAEADGQPVTWARPGEPFFTFECWEGRTTVGTYCRQLDP